MKDISLHNQSQFGGGSGRQSIQACCMIFMLLLGITFAEQALAAKGGGTSAPKFDYYAIGNPDIEPQGLVAPTTPSYVLMGGGPDVDEAFRWMITRAGVRQGTGGRLVIIRASGKDDYNPYLYYTDGGKSIAPPDMPVDGWVGGAGLGLSSVETLVIPSREAAEWPEVIAKVARANAIFIAGGDQANYIRFWAGTALDTTLQALMAKNVPIGGTSAGLAVMGGFDFAALNDTITSPEALLNPFDSRVTIEPSDGRGNLSPGGAFIAPPAFSNLIFDSHLDTRDRMGRLVTFVSRMIERQTDKRSKSAQGCSGGVISNSLARGVGVSVETALLVWGEGTGQNARIKARRVTNVSTTTESAVYFVNLESAPSVCENGIALQTQTSAITVRKLADSAITIDFSDPRNGTIAVTTTASGGNLSVSPY